MKNSFFVLRILVALSLFSLVGCSSPKIVRVPTPLSVVSSPYDLHRDWQLTLDKFDYSDSEGLYFAADKDKVYFSVPSGLITAVTQQVQSRWTDQVVWQRKLGEPVMSGPALSGQHLILGTSKGNLYSLNADNGAIDWFTGLTSEVLSLPLVVDGTIYVRTVDGKLSSVNAKTGTVNWTVEHILPNLSLRGIAPVTLDEGSVYVGWEDGVVEALDARTGEHLWESQVAIPSGRTDLERMVDLQARIVYRDGRLIVLGYHGKLVSLSAETGRLYWSKKVSGFRDFVVDDKRIYLSDDDDVLHAYDRGNGTEIWKNAGLKYRILSDVVNYAANQLVVGDGSGVIHWIDKLTGAEIGHVVHDNEGKLSAKIVRITVKGRQLRVQDTDGFVTQYHVVPSDWYKFNRPMDPLKILSSN